MPLKIVYRPLARLVPYERNARTHSEDEVQQVMNSIRAYGWTNPVLIDPDDKIIAGHRRVLAGLKLGMVDGPCIVLGHLTEAQRRAYIIADNKIALNAGWNEEMLRLELTDLSEMGADLGLLGFGEDELDDLMKAGDAHNIAVKEVQTGKVEDTFWIQITGPLARQADALLELKGAMAKWPEIDVRLGTVEDGT